MERLALGADAVLPLQQAAALLPMADREAREWLRDRGLVRQLAGRDVVIWGDITDALRANETPPPSVPSPPRPHGRIRL